jgi:hypothetical protein
MLVRHFQCKESLKAAHSLTEAMDRFAQATAIRSHLQQNCCPHWDNHIGAGLSRRLCLCSTMCQQATATNSAPNCSTTSVQHWCEKGLEGRRHGRSAKESAQVFAQRAIMESSARSVGICFSATSEYHLNVSDVAERDGEDKLLGEGRLAVTIECSGCGFLKIGPAIAALEEEAAGLGAAFYWTLTYALYRVMRIYNHDDALQYEERMREYAEDDEENREQYEFPEVEKALPECIQKTLKTENHRAFTLGARQLLMKHARGKFRGWIERLRSIQRLSRLRLPADGYFREAGGYDTIPLPSLVVAFKEHDAIVACFDEEGQYMLEGSAEPTLGVVFSPQKPEEVRQALRVVGRFIAINDELFQLVEALQEWEKRDADTCLDRGEPSLRAA